MPLERPLRLGSGLDGLAGAREGIEEGVTLRIDFDAALGGEGVAQELAMLRESRGVAFSECVKKAGRTLDVGKEQCDGSGGERPRGLHALRLRRSSQEHDRGSSQSPEIETFVKSNWSSRFGSQPLTVSSLRITHVDHETGI
jgi:hypothetical protein